MLEDRACPDMPWVVLAMVGQLSIARLSIKLHGGIWLSYRKISVIDKREYKRISNNGTHYS